MPDGKGELPLMVPDRNAPGSRSHGDVLVAEQSAGYLTLLRAEGDGKAQWISRHVEDLNRPYGLAWRNDHLLAADQDAIWRVPHTLGNVRPGRPRPAQRAEQVAPALGWVRNDSAAERRVA